MGKGKLLPSANQIPLNQSSVTKFECRDYVVDPYHQNLDSIGPGIFAPYIGEIYTYTPFLFEIDYAFLVPQLAYRRVR